MYVSELSMKAERSGQLRATLLVCVGVKDSLEIFDSVARAECLLLLLGSQETGLAQFSTARQGFQEAEVHGARQTCVSTIKLREFRKVDKRTSFSSLGIPNEKAECLSLERNAFVGGFHFAKKRWQQASLGCEVGGGCMELGMQS